MAADCWEPLVILVAATAWGDCALPLSEERRAYGTEERRCDVVRQDWWHVIRVDGGIVGWHLCLGLYSGFRIGTRLFEWGACLVWCFFRSGFHYPFPDYLWNHGVHWGTHHGCPLQRTGGLRGRDRNGTPVAESPKWAWHT